MTKIVKDKNNALGNGYEKVSRWITIEDTIISSRHRLASFADTSGAELCLTYFRYKGKQYALSQFMKLITPIVLEDGTVLSGFDSTRYYQPLLLEMSSTGEAVRLWQEVEMEAE